MEQAHRPRCAGRFSRPERLASASSSRRADSLRSRSSGQSHFRRRMDGLGGTQRCSIRRRTIKAARASRPWFFRDQAKAKSTSNSDCCGRSLPLGYGRHQRGEMSEKPHDYWVPVELSACGDVLGGHRFLRSERVSNVGCGPLPAHDIPAAILAISNACFVGPLRSSQRPSILISVLQRKQERTHGASI